MKPRLNPRLYYFTVEDESLLAEVFPRFEDDIHAIAYKVRGTEDVVVATADTRDAMERHDVPFSVLAEEDGTRISVHHTPLSREELADYEDGIRALALAYRAIAVACVGVNGAAAHEAFHLVVELLSKVVAALGSAVHGFLVVGEGHWVSPLCCAASTGRPRVGVRRRAPWPATSR